MDGGGVFNEPVLPEPVAKGGGVFKEPVLPEPIAGGGGAFSEPVLPEPIAEGGGALSEPVLTGPGADGGGGTRKGPVFKGSACSKRAAFNNERSTLSGGGACTGGGVGFKGCDCAGGKTGLPTGSLGANASCEVLTSVWSGRLGAGLEAGFSGNCSSPGSLSGVSVSGEMLNLAAFMIDRSICEGRGGSWAVWICDLSCAAAEGIPTFAGGTGASESSSGRKVSWAVFIVERSTGGVGMGGAGRGST